MKTIVIAGSGPAGLAAGIAASSDKTKVIIIEQKEKPGLKLLASGGGRCNVTNILAINDFIHRFHRNQKFIRPALINFDNIKLRAFLLEHGVKTSVLDGFYIFPNSQRASDVLKVFYEACLKRNVQFRFSQKVISLKIEENKLQGVQLSSGEILDADAFIIATGGKSYPILGATGEGYILAEQAQHSIITPVPGLVAVNTKEQWFLSCTGIVFPNASLRVAIPKVKLHSTGELLITHQGISGPAVLDLAGEIAYLLQTNKQPVPLECCWNADMNRMIWEKLFQEWHTIHGKKLIRNLLTKYFPQSFANNLYKQACGEIDFHASEFSNEKKKKLLTLLSECPLSIVQTGNFDRAMITRGGVNVSEVNPTTLESRIVSGLYFAGEVLDIDGPCGGFNLQWAFSSGTLAGQSILKKNIVINA